MIVKTTLKLAALALAVLTLTSTPTARPMRRTRNFPT